MGINFNALWCVISEMGSGVPWWFSTIINPHDWKQVACNEWHIQSKVKMLPDIAASKKDEQLIYLIFCPHSLKDELMKTYDKRGIFLVFL